MVRYYVVGGYNHEGRGFHEDHEFYGGRNEAEAIKIFNELKDGLDNDLNYGYQFFELVADEISGTAEHISRDEHYSTTFSTTVD